MYRGGNGGWVSEGLEVVSNKSGANLSTVECNSTHLTNFAVLVDVAGGLEVHKGINHVLYIVEVIE